MVYIQSYYPLAFLASSAIATKVDSLAMPDGQIVHRRDVTGPEYQCHSDCGNVIISGRSGSTSYCDTETYTTELAGCMKCAETYNIWQYYGESVEAAASACGDDATPSPSSAGSAAAQSTESLVSSSSEGVAVSTSAAGLSSASTGAPEGSASQTTTSEALTAGLSHSISAVSATTASIVESAASSTLASAAATTASTNTTSINSGASSVPSTASQFTGLANIVNVDTTTAGMLMALAMRFVL